MSDPGIPRIRKARLPDDAEVAALSETRLVQFPTIVVFHRAELEAIGVEVAATFRTPHVTLATDSLDHLIERLLACNYTERPNPSHVAEGT